MGCYFLDHCTGSRPVRVRQHRGCGCRNRSDSVRGLSRLIYHCTHCRDHAAEKTADQHVSVRSGRAVYPLAGLLPDRLNEIPGFLHQCILCASFYRTIKSERASCPHRIDPLHPEKNPGTPEAVGRRPPIRSVFFYPSISSSYTQISIPKALAHPLLFHLSDAVLVRSPDMEAKTWNKTDTAHLGDGSLPA